MLRCWSVLLVLLLAAPAQARSSPPDERELNAYFGVWADDQSIKPDVIDRYYSTRVDYYGQLLTLKELYRNKLSLVRLWPYRQYTVEPGSVLRSCNADRTRCDLNLILNWRAINPFQSRGTEGSTTVSLTMVYEDGRMKIRRENGVPILRSNCKLLGSDWTDKSSWTCTPLALTTLPQQHDTRFPSQ